MVNKQESYERKNNHGEPPYRPPVVWVGKGETVIKFPNKLRKTKARRS